MELTLACGDGQEDLKDTLKRVALHVVEAERQ